jgi:hypothetical protein
MTPEEEGSDVREMVWVMSRTTNRILFFGIASFFDSGGAHLLRHYHILITSLHQCLGIHMHAGELLGDGVLWPVFLLRQPLMRHVLPNGAFSATTFTVFKLLA